MTEYDKLLTLEQIVGIQDDDLDFSDVSELGLDEDFWQDAKLVAPDRKGQSPYV